ncbi:MAG: hypothetical protein AB1486_23585 [Planctomycetota bacterium]
MLDVLFVQGQEPLIVRREANPRFTSLAACVRAAGFSCAVVERSLMEWSLAEAAEITRLLAPRLVAVDAAESSPEALACLCRALRERRRDLFIVACGVATLDAAGLHELLGADTSPDLLLLGEGERALVEVVGALSAGRSFATVPNIARLDGEELVVSADASREPDPDGLPEPAPDGAGEWALLTGLATLRVGRLSPLGPAGLPGPRLCSIDLVARQIEGLARSEGFHRFLLRGAEDAPDADELIAWLGQLGREVRRRDLEVVFFLSVGERGLEPELLASYRALGLQALVVEGQGQIRLAERMHSIALARELGLRVVPHFAFFTPHTRLEEIGPDLTALRQCATMGDPAPFVFGRGGGHELYLVPFSRFGVGCGVPFYDGRVARLFEVSRALFECCYLPLYSGCARLERFARVMRRDSGDRALERMEPALWNVLERVFPSMVTVLEELTRWVRDEAACVSPDVMDRADSAVARALAERTRFEDALRDRDALRGLRYLCDPGEGRWCVCAGGAERIELFDGDPLIREMARLHNRLPRRVILARLARAGPAQQLASTYERLRRLEEADSHETLASLPNVELPGAALADHGVRGA